MKREKIYKELVEKHPGLKRPIYHIQKEWPGLYKILANRGVQSAKEVYDYLHHNQGSECVHPDCNESTVFRSFKAGYALYCSLGCQNTDPERVQRAVRATAETKLRAKSIKQQTTHLKLLAAAPRISKRDLLKHLQSTEAERKHITTHSYLRQNFYRHHSALVEMYGEKYTPEEVLLYLKPNAQRYCKSCGKKTNFARFTQGYFLFCSRMCAITSKEKTLNTRKTCMERYGVRSPMQVPEISKKVMIQALNVHTEVFKGREVQTQGSYALLAYKALARRYGVHNVHSEFQDSFPLDRLRGVGATPDIYISSIDKFVEIKSLWTLTGSYHWKRARRQARRLEGAGIDTVFVVVSPNSCNRYVKLPDGWHKWAKSRLHRYVSSKFD